MSDAALDRAAPAPASPLAAEGWAILRLALPIMLIALVNMGMSVTDAVMISRLFGAEALAGVAVGSDLYSILFYLGAGVLGGLAPFYTAAVVRANPGERARLERIGHVTVALLALVLVPAVWWAPDWLATLGLEPDLLHEGRGYTRAMAITLVPMLGVSMYRTILTAAEKPRVFLKVTLAMLPLNAAANYVLMTGAGPFPAFGPAGAGLSSLAVATASLAVLVLVAGRGVPVVRPRPLADWRGVAAVLRLGLPIGVATVAEVGVFLGATVYAATLGAADVAAHTLALRTAGVAYAVPVALLQAAMVRGARAETLGDPALRRVVAASAMGLAVLAGSVICAAVLLAAEPLGRVLIDGSAAGLAAAQAATGLLVLLGVMEIAANPGSTASGLLRGRKQARAPMIFTLAGHWAIGAPTGICLCEVAGLGITGIWIGLTAGTLVSAAATVAYLLAARGPMRWPGWPIASRFARPALT